MSVPEANAFSPAPRSTITRSVGSPFAASQIFASSSYIAKVRALRASGRLKVIQATSPRRSWSRSGMGVSRESKKACRASANGTRDRVEPKDTTARLRAPSRGASAARLPARVDEDGWTRWRVHLDAMLDAAEFVAHIPEGGRAAVRGFAAANVARPGVARPDLRADRGTGHRAADGCGVLAAAAPDLMPEDAADDRSGDRAAHV